MGLLNDAAVVNIEGNTKQLVDQINKADKAMQNFDKTLTDILSHLTAVENGLKNVNGVTNNFNKTQKGNFFNARTDTFVGSRGKVASFTDTKSKAYQQAADDYHKTQLQEIEVMKKQIEKDKKIIEYKDEQIKNYFYEAQTRRLNAKAKNGKNRYLTSDQHLAYEEGLGIKHKNLEGWYAAKSAHPERFLAGALNYSFGYQGARALNGIGDSVRGLGVGGRLAGDVLNTAASFLKAPAAGLMAVFRNLGQEMVDLGKAATQAYAEIESIKTQLGVVFSNQTQADAMFGQISQYAVKSPFGVQQTSELAVLLKQSGVYASDLMDTLRMLGDTAGGNMEKMKRIANNYAQIVSIGKASMLDMRQFAYAGIPIFEAVSKELGVSQQELRKLISEGKVTSDIIEKVFKDLTGINGLFENATEKGAKTLKARLQNLADARQLAFGQIGEWGVKLGTQTGGDSFVNKLVDIAEKMYDHLKTEVSTVNIEKDVQTIATRNDNIERYKTLIEFAQTIGSKSLEAAFTDKLNKELAKLNPDEARSTYVKSYQSKTRGFDLLNENDVIGTVASIQQEINELYEKITNLNVGYWKNEEINRLGLDKLFAAGRVADAKQGTLLGMAERGSDARLQVDALQERAKLLEEILDALKDYNNISDELRRAIKEDTAIQAQQLAFDTTNRNADASTSLMASFNELASLYESSEEYKKKEEEKKLEILTKAQNELKGIAQKADENGNVRFNEFDRNEFQRLNNAGAFNATKLDIVQGNKQLTAENRAKLESQFANASGKILEEFAGSRLADTVMGKEAMKEFQTRFMSLASAGSDEDFFKKFGSVITDMSNALKQLENFNPADREWLQSLQQYLIQSTNSYETRVKGVNADLTTTEVEKAADQFIPLWKRILAGATGLTTNGMTDTISTMTNYRDDMAVRNMTKGVLRATMQSMGYDATMGLIKSGGAAQLKGDNGLTFQTDWKKTQEAIRKFALSLDSTTAVVTAYKNGLQAELDTYTELIALAPTQEESQDLKNQKTVSASKLSKLSGDQLVNAFGEFIETADGTRYKASEISFDENGKMFDNLGHEIKEEVVLTGKLFDFIKAELPRVSKELAEAKGEETNKKYNDKVREAALLRQLPVMANNNKTPYMGKITKFLMENPEYLQEQFNNFYQDIFNEEAKKSSLSGLNMDQVLDYALKGTPDFIREKIEEMGDEYDPARIRQYIRREIDANSLVQKVLENVYKKAGELINNTENAENTAVTRDIDTMKWYYENQIPYKSQYNAENYGGARGLRNTLFRFASGTGLNSDYEDRIAFLLRNDASARGKVNEARERKALEDNEWGKNPDFKLDLITKDDLDPLAHSNEELAKMLTLSEQLIVLWGTEGKDIGKALDQIGTSAGSMVANFTSDAISSSFELWGKYLKDSSKASSEIAKNLGELSANLLKNLGSMVTQAGLSLAISSVGDKKRVLAGLAIAAAGGGLSFLGGALGGALEDDDSKSDSEYEKLLRIKQDLADLLKQAREDAIYYENTVRHKKAISANENFTKAVHDAIITPRGDVVTTDPKDYLIATKTPKTLVGGGAPTINFSVVDKSTGIKVTQQRSTYDEATNTIEFEAIIESKVQEIIATSKGDEAFSAREARLNGRTVIA